MTVELKDSSGNSVMVQEGESANITATIEFDGTTFNKAAIATLVMTLYDKSTKEIINRRIDQDILDANGSSVATGGTLTIELDSKNKVFTASASTNKLSITGHGLADGDRIWLRTSGTLPGGLPTSGYVVNKTANDLQVATTLGGSAVDITSAGSGTHRLLSGDNVVVGAHVPEGQAEMHIARIQWTWNDGDSVRTGVEELSFYVQKMTIVVDPE